MLPPHSFPCKFKKVLCDVLRLPRIATSKLAVTLDPFLFDFAEHYFYMKHFEVNNAIAYLSAVNCSCYSI